MHNHCINKLLNIKDVIVKKFVLKQNAPGFFMKPSALDIFSTIPLRQYVLR